MSQDHREGFEPLGVEGIERLMGVVGEMITIEEVKKMRDETTMVPYLQALFEERESNHDFFLYVYRHIYLFGYMNAIITYDTAVEKGVDPLTLLTEDRDGEAL